MNVSGVPMAKEVCINNNNTVKLQSCDGEILEVEEEVASTSGFIKKLMRDLGTNTTPPLPVSAKTLRIVFQYCRYHVIDAPNAPPDIVKTWENNFVKAFADDRVTFFEVTVAANYLIIKNLLEFMCQTIADMMKGKALEEMPELFIVKNEND